MKASNLKRWDIFKLLRKANTINDINNNIILPKSLWETITIIKIVKKMNILREFLLKSFLTMKPDNQIKKNSLEISDICNVNIPRFIHLVAPFTVKPMPGM